MVQGYNKVLLSAPQEKQADLNQGKEGRERVTNYISAVNNCCEHERERESYDGILICFRQQELYQARQSSRVIWKFSPDLVQDEYCKIIEDLILRNGPL